MQNGMTYMVRPCMHPVNIFVILAFISTGSAQLLVGPASTASLEQMNVQPSTRATSRTSDRHRKELGRFFSFSRVNVPDFTSCWHRSAFSSQADSFSTP